MRTKTAGIAAFLLFAGFVLVGAAPTASAHLCADHYDCDAGGCTDGENHEHTDYNDDTEDGHCKSVEGPKDCKFLGRKFTGKECKVLRDGELPPPI